METEPGKAPLVRAPESPVILRSRSVRRLDLIWYVCNCALGIPDRPGGVVEVRRSRRRVRRNAHPPAFIEHNRRTESGGIKHR